MRIKEIRLQRNISQKELAVTLGIAPNTLSQYENEKREPDIGTLELIADFFNVSVDCLLGREKEKPTPEDGDGLDDATLEREFMRWFRAQSPGRQKEVLFDLAKAVTGHDE